MLKATRSLEMVAAPTIHQEDVETLIGIRNQVRQLHKLYQSTAADLFSRLRSGATLEPGTHTIEIDEREDGPSLTLRLLIDGQEA